MNIGDLFERYGRWVARRRGIASLILFILTLLAGSGIALRLADGVPVDFTPQAMFMGEGGAWERIKAYEAEFGAEDNDVVLILQGPLSTPDGIDVIRKIHAKVAAVAQVQRVDSLANAMLATGDGNGMNTHWPEVCQAGGDQGESPKGKIA